MTESQDWVGSRNKGRGHQGEELAKMNGANDLNAYKKKISLRLLCSILIFFLNDTPSFNEQCLEG